MSDSDQELINDYVLGEMVAEAAAAFEIRLANEPALARAVTAMEETVAWGAVAETPAAEPPAALRALILAEAEPVPTPAARPNKVLGFPFWTAMGWGAAAALAILAAVIDGRLRDRDEQVTELSGELAMARGRLDDVSNELAELAGDREQLARRLVELESRSRLDTLRIAVLNSQLDQAAAFGFAVFDPETDEGVIEVINLPAIDAESQDYQLWVVDPQYPNPVDGGVISVDAQGHTRVRFSAMQPVTEVAAFAVSLERKGGVSVAEGPMVLVGAL